MLDRGNEEEQEQKGYSGKKEAAVLIFSQYYLLNPAYIIILDISIYEMQEVK